MTNPLDSFKHFPGVLLVRSSYIGDTDHYARLDYGLGSAAHWYKAKPRGWDLMVDAKGLEKDYQEWLKDDEYDNET